jgi:hypothetical protein
MMIFDRPTADELRAVLQAALDAVGSGYLNTPMDMDIKRRMESDFNAWLHGVGVHRYPNHYRWPRLVVEARPYIASVGVEWERVRFNDNGSVTYLDDVEAELQASYAQAMKEKP